MVLTTRQLGKSSLHVSILGVGCNAFGTRIDADRSAEVVNAALESGVNFFDTADVYGLGQSEEFLGRALGNRRSEVIVATKFGMDMNGVNGDDGGRRGSAAYVRTAVEASLRRLGTDWIDLYQFHTPDRRTDLDETLGALTELVAEGKVRAIGCSNMVAWELVDGLWRSQMGQFASFDTIQNEYSLYNRAAEVELFGAASTKGVSVLPYFPLAYGLLTGKYRADVPPAPGTRLQTQAHRYDTAKWDVVEQLRSFAAARDLSMLQLALGALADRDVIGSVIAGATRPAQIIQNVAAIAWRPTAADREELDAIAQPSLNHTPFAT